MSPEPSEAHHAADADDYYHFQERQHPHRDRSRRHKLYSYSPEDAHHQQYSYYHGEPAEEGKKKWETLSKVAIVATLVGGLLHIWHTEKSAEKEREYWRRRKKDFSRAKKARRREEERREREAESDYDEEPVPEARRIGYVQDGSKSREQSKAPRRIEPPRSKSRRRSRARDVEDEGYQSDRREASRMR